LKEKAGLAPAFFVAGSLSVLAQKVGARIDDRPT
jgi:hypothetical protein